MKKIVQTPHEIKFDGRMHPSFTPISRGCYAIWRCSRLLVAMLPSPPLQRSQVADHITLVLRTGFEYDGWYSPDPDNVS